MTTVLQYLVIAAVVGLLLFGVALLLFGRGERLAALPARTSPARLPERGIAGSDVRQVRFALAVRGYRMSDVDWTLERLADELDRTRQQLALLTGGADDDERTATPTANGTTDARPGDADGAATDGAATHDATTRDTTRDDAWLGGAPAATEAHGVGDPGPRDEMTPPEYEVTPRPAWAPASSIREADPATMPPVDDRSGDATDGLRGTSAASLSSDHTVTGSTDDPAVTGSTDDPAVTGGTGDSSGAGQRPVTERPNRPSPAPGTEV